MVNVFTVELSAGNGRYCELELPATPYELLDALEQIQLGPGDTPDWEILDCRSFEFLPVHLEDECDLYQLNALSAALSQLDRAQSTAFEGLFQMEVAKKYGPIRISTMIDLAYSTDCCHVVGEARNDSQLGRFYAENGFIPAVESVPDSIFELLDFEQLGRKARLEEGGVFTETGYVVRHSELKQVYDSLPLAPRTPDYTIRLRIARYPFETNGQPEKQAILDLPATQETLSKALEECGAASWDEVVYQAEDSAVPHMLDALDFDGIQELNELAQAIQYRKGRDELTKLKAVLHAAGCREICEVQTIAEELDDFGLEPGQRTVEEVAEEELRCILDPQSLVLLRKHVDLSGYGRALVNAGHASLTPYGLVERLDGAPIRAMENESQRDGMEMMR